jgi:hypothetical protein
MCGEYKEPARQPKQTHDMHPDRRPRKHGIKPNTNMDPNRRPRKHGIKPNTDMDPNRRPRKYGIKPNTSMLSIPRAELEAHPRYVLLPATAVKQGSPAYMQLREQQHFRASESYMALGFHDKHTHDALGIPRYQASLQASACIYSAILRGDTYSALWAVPNEVRDTNFAWGVAHEPNSIMTYLEAFPEHRVRESTIYTGSMRDHARRFAGMHGVAELEKCGHLTVSATPDGEILDEHGQVLSLLEVKSATEFIGDLDRAFYMPVYEHVPRKPHDKVKTIYVPQLMMQMLATGCPQNRYLSCTVTNGANVIRVDYDEAYAFEMLYWMAFSYNRAAEADRNLEPHEHAKSIQAVLEKHRNLDDRRYKDFVEKTVRISDEAPIIKHIEQSVVGTDQTVFYDE